MFDPGQVDSVLSGPHNAFRLLCPAGRPPFLFGIRHPKTILPEEILFRSTQIHSFRRNLRGFLDGLPPLPALLHGSPGTGKTSIVLALWNEWNLGNPTAPLRIVQADRQGIDVLPPLLDRLSTSPVFFLILLDDLTFPAEDPSFHQLKALLDGGVIPVPDNVLLAVTSNVRHLVAESRSASLDALHPEETRNDALALYSRFGISLTFEEPSQEEYLHLVLAKSLGAGLLSGIPEDWKNRWDSWVSESGNQWLDPPDAPLRLLQKSLGFSRDRASRSGRTAQRFVDLMLRGLLP